VNKRLLLRLLCWAGVIGIVVLLVFANTYDVPTTSHWEPGHEECEPADYGHPPGCRWVPGEWVDEKDYSDVPLYVEIGSHWGLIPCIIVGLVLLWGGVNLWGMEKK